MASTVGVRELRDNLSRWIKRAQAGEEVIVTDRGRPVVRLLGSGQANGLARLIAEGLATPPRMPKTDGFDRPIVNARGSVSDLVRDQRR